MKLRTRLFLWIGTLFLLFAVISYFFENFLVQRHLKESKKEMRNRIQKNEEQVRLHYEDFLGIVMADFQAKIDALLYRLDEYSALKTKFLKSGPYQSWFSTSLLLLENKWIGFIQNTDNQKLSSLVMASPSTLRFCQKKIIDKDLAWIRFYNDPEDKIYMGIRISSQEIKEYLPFLIDFDVEKQPDEYLFYDPQTLLSLNFEIGKEQPKKPLTQQEVDRLKIIQKNFLKKLKKAKDYINRGINVKKGSFESQAKATIFPKDLLKRMSPHLSDVVYDEFTESLTENINNDLVIRQIWKLNSLMFLDLFGLSPLSKKAPLGITSIFAKEKVGAGIFTSSVMFNSKVFEDEKYYLRNLSTKKTMIPSSIELIKDPFKNRLFLANTLKYDENSYLTIGINIANMLQRLSLAANQYALLVHNNKLLTVYNPQGLHVRESSFYQISPDELINDKGTITVNGEKYYYLKLEPYKGSNLHFYILNLESKAFSFVNYIIEEMTSLINKISFSMRAIGIIALSISLVLLHNIAKKVSKPISELAKVTESIAEGHYDKVEIPKVPFGPSKEVRTLCQAFAQMVKGLKDKEKVRAVLNKVVSKEIAEEILKGTVHLGGEEKMVTILFADIRNFTKLTEKMLPQEVIEILNLTMTKISQVIDKCGGVIDKFVGDEVMALFGAPMGDPQASIRALVSAKEMVQKLNELNQQRKIEQKPQIHIGVGIHTGVVVAGNMGAENRLNYTVLGANVNLASRVCSVAKENEILITENTLNASKEKGKVDVQKLEPVTLKGFTEAIVVYRLKEVEFDLQAKESKDV